MVIEGKGHGIGYLPFDVCSGGELTGNSKHVAADVGGDEPGIGEDLL